MKVYNLSIIRALIQMKKRTKIILIITVGLIVLGTILGIVDYHRIRNNETPLFMIRITDARHEDLNYIGLGYRMQRTVGISPKESLCSARELRFGTWFYITEIDIKCPRFESGNSTGTAEYLFDLRTPYIDDNSAVGRLLESLEIWLYGQFTFELQTSAKPYALIINYSVIQGWGSILDQPEIVTRKSAILLALIENAEEIHWALPDIEIYKVTVRDLYDRFGNIKEYGKSVDNFRKLLIQFGYFEEKDPISMSIKNLTDSGLTLIITNHTNDNFLWGEGFTLEQKKNTRWISVPPINDYAVIAIGYTLSAYQKIERGKGWLYGYGRLPRGEYRITKTFSHLPADSEHGWYGKTHIISAEFIIS